MRRDIEKLLKCLDEDFSAYNSGVNLDSPGELAKHMGEQSVKQYVSDWANKKGLIHGVVTEEEYEEEDDDDDEE